MKPKFELDGDEGARLPERLIDPEAFDASEQQFAASLEQAAPSATTNFVLDADDDGGEGEKSAPAHALTITEYAGGEISKEDSIEVAGDPPAVPVQTEGEQSQDADSWRNEVAARVNKYRARRRPREPRYPSLQLKFEPYEPLPASRPALIESPAQSRSGRQAISLDSVASAAEITAPEPLQYLAPPPVEVETTARILEFPRSFTFMPAPRPVDELAEPVIDRPRILDVPEIEPPPPAMGGISIEAVEAPASERRPGFEVPLQSAPMSRRLAAVATDTLMVLFALTAFCYIFFRITAVIPEVKSSVGMFLTLAGIFWVGYQYLLLVYTGTTPGLKLAKLRLDRFDGTAVPRKIRRWRVLASALSGLSLGLGYAWCFLDEDQLCWHDRITRTYMAPIK
jgi:hypothetical protein